MAQTLKLKNATKGPRTQVKKYVVDFSGPANDKIFSGSDYEKFLLEKIKVEGKTGRLEGRVTVKREGNGSVVINATEPFSKRYIKYLTKKYLRKEQMREWLRVVSTGRQSYSIRIFNILGDTDE